MYFHSTNNIYLPSQNAACSSSMPGTCSNKTWWCSLAHAFLPTLTSCFLSTSPSFPHLSRLHPIFISFTKEKPAFLFLCSPPGIYISIPYYLEYNCPQKMSHMQIWLPSIRKALDKYLSNFVCPQNISRKQLLNGNLFTVLNTRQRQLLFYYDTN